MRRLVLTKKVEVVGPDYFGRDSTLTIMPSPIPGMFWDTGHSIIEITADILRRRTRRLTLEHHGKRLNIAEHILVLRTLGINNFIVACESEWPPYDGSAQALWAAVYPFAREWVPFEYTCTPKRMVRAEVSKNPHRWIEIRPSDEPLAITVEINYPGIGAHTETFGHPFERTCLNAKALGWPTWTKLVCTLLHPLRLAPHVKNMTWADEQDNHKTLQLAARHRALDILGTLAVAYPKDAAPHAHVISHLGGHECDLALVKKLSGDMWKCT